MKFSRSLLLLFLFTGMVSSKAQTISSWKVTKLQDYISKSDSVLVISFWATFCKPCNEEIPYFESIVKKYKDQKVKLLLVSLDLKDGYPGKIKLFVKKNKYSSQIVWLNETDADYFCPKVDKEWSGGIPSTLIVNSKTGYRKFFEEQMKPGEFETELKKAL
ncbi:MAG TPA: TlpA disulfide reductase family protein [Chitinophagaceae bacterium]|nr:TlpA disulfide reductase family protein [Chitinophagaceae bacterium]